MTEIINGVEGNWETRESRIIEDGEYYRFGGTWHGYGESLDLNRAFNPSAVQLDDEDTAEVFVPIHDENALPTADAIYADIDGDLWLLRHGDWKYLSGEADYAQPEYYAPFNKVAELWGNFTDEN